MKSNKINDNIHQSTHYQCISYRCIYKNDKTLLKNIAYFFLKISLSHHNLKAINRVQNRYLSGTEFYGVRTGKMG